METTAIIMIIIGYLAGSVNSAIITCKLLGLPSPRTVGSGNPGATNVLRLGGKKAAIITLTGDALKGLLPVLIAYLLNLSPVYVACVALAAIIGHIFPIFFGFKGGKGVATLIGVMFGFSWYIGLIFLGIWLLVAYTTKYSSLSSILATVLIPIAVYFFYGTSPTIIFGIIAIIVVVRHHENIQRLIKGTESKIGQKTK
ncbi:glycerol-3-phosphate 1-O-acyltransferase PlsY [Francisellaceae bacterium]|nr:glycerol-3-phosphate 1-O-acyltransferase PlsY [Francisellaceae bacterium]